MQHQNNNNQNDNNQNDNNQNDNNQEPAEHPTSLYHTYNPTT